MVANAIGWENARLRHAAIASESKPVDRKPAGQDGCAKGRTLSSDAASSEDVIVAPSVRDLEELERQLTDWMHRRMADADQLRLTNFAYPFGAGRSHETILFDATWKEGGEDRGQGFVVRIKPSAHTYYPDDLFDEQIRVMQVLNRQGRVKVARIFWHEPDAAVLGQPFFVMEKKQGRVAVSTPPYVRSGWVTELTPDQRAKMWDSGIRQLATIPGTPLDSIDFLADRAGRTLRGLEQEWDMYERFLKWVSADRRWPFLEDAMQDLRRRWPKNQPAGLVWGDARIGNMMFDENFEVSAVVDWEQPSLGGALHDLAWWNSIGRMNESPRFGHPVREGIPGREETIALWREVSGISTDDIEWYEEFTGLKIALLSIRTAEFRGQPAPDDDRFRFLIKPLDS